MTATAADRLSPRDFYRQLDWIRDEWSDDELQIAWKLHRLRRLLEQLPEPFYSQARPKLRELEQARIYAGRPWQQTLRTLADLIGEWNQARPALLECEVCGLEVRGRSRLAGHLELFHGRKPANGAAIA